MADFENSANSGASEPTRTHLSFDKGAPISRGIEAVGRMFALPVLRGLHHQYVRI